MDFFKDFSDMTPAYSKQYQSSVQRNINPKPTTINSNKDQFDDLLSNLMSKEEIKKNKRNADTFSSHNIDSSTYDMFGKTTEKFFYINTETDLNLNYGLSRQGNKASKKSILDELMSEDNRSIKSGAPGLLDRQSNLTKNLEVSINNQISQSGISGRVGMRPPLKKKAQSRQLSVFNDDIKSIKRINDNQDLDAFSNPFPKSHIVQLERVNKLQNIQKCQTSKEIQLFKPLQVEKQTQQPSIKIESVPIIQQKIIEKIIHIKQENKQITIRHQQELKLIKQSYERQITNLKSNYEKIIEQQQNNRKILVKTYEENAEIERIKWDKIIKEETQRIKSIYQWQQSKKTQSYQLQVNKLKHLLQTFTTCNTLNSSQSNTYSIMQQTSLQLSIKIKELEEERSRVQQQKQQIETKKRQLQSQQRDFNFYRRKQQNNLNQERKKLFQYQTQIRKKQVNMKKQVLTEKQSLASELASTELFLAQAKQTIRHQNQKLNMEKQLFEQQKLDYEKINNKILHDLKERQKILDIQKQQTYELQVQLYKKLHTIQLMTNQKCISNPKLNQSLNQTKKRPSTVNRSSSFYSQSFKENSRHRANSQLDQKIALTKDRYQQMEQIARQNSMRKQAVKQDSNKIHLQKYIQKLGREKLKLAKY